MTRPAARTRWAFAVGTLGRDMAYTMMSMFLMVFLTEVLDLSNAALWWITGILLAARAFDAVTDLVMGAIVDNTHTRWGRYKPWIALGIGASALLTVGLFVDPGLRGTGFVAWFAVVYVLWGLAYTAHDIPYWSMVPALTPDQRERERLSSLTKIFATIGLFTVVVAVIPVTTALGGDARAWTTFAVGVVVVMLLGQTVTLVGVRDPGLDAPRQHTSLRTIGAVIRHNDQLRWTALSLLLFLTGFTITTSLGVYFFKYVFGDEGMYSPFAAVLGVAQLLGFATLPALRRRLTRRQLFTLAMALIVAGYVLLYASPLWIVPIGVAGLLLFVGCAYVVVLMIAFISDCIEYGEWKLGRRDGAVTFALQPFVYKLAGALASGAVGATLILTGVNEAAGPADVSTQGVLGIKLMMMGVPLLLMVASYLVFRTRYVIDEAAYARILADLSAPDAAR